MKMHELSVRNTVIQPLPEFTDVGQLQPVAPEIDLDAVAAGLDLERLYQAQIQQYPVLDAEQEVELAKRIEAGVYAGYKLLKSRQNGEAIPPPLRKDLQTLEREGAAAKETLTTSNLRLVMKFARKYKFRLPFMDAVQYGNIGLMTAVEKFDYAKDTKFSTLAAWYIRNAIREGRRSSYGFELSKREIEDLDTLRSAEGQAVSNPKGSSIQHLAKETDLTPKRIKLLNGLTQSQDTWDMPAYRDSRITLTEVTSNEEYESDVFRASDGLSSAADEIFAVMSDPDIYSNELHAKIMRWRWGLHDGQLRTRAQVIEILGLSMSADTLGSQERQAGKSVIGALIERGYDIHPDQELSLDLRGQKVS